MTSPPDRGDDPAFSSDRHDDPASPPERGDHPASPPDHGDHPASPHDRGASPERTRLAWRRTALSGAAVTLLAVRPAFDPDAGIAAILVAATAMVAWVILVRVGYRRGARLRARPPRPARWSVIVYALVTVSFAVIGSLVVTF